MVDNTRDLRVLVASRYPLIMAETRDEVRFMALVRRAADASNLPVWTWSMTQGLRRDGVDGPAFATIEADKALQFVSSVTEPGVFVFNDVQHALEDALVVRRVKEIGQRATPGVTLVLGVPALKIPPELDGLALPWKLQPPTREEVQEIVDRNLKDLAQRGISVTLSDAEHQEMVESCLGLSAAEAGQLIQEAAFDDNKVDAADVEYVRKAKAEILGQGGVLELIETTAGSLDQVGGLEKLKAWLRVRGEAFEPAAKDFGLDPPRGVLLTGVPGCGKSLVARTLARTWSMPLLLLDPARLYGPYVGESEQRLRDSLATVEAMAPAVLWIDEIEKGLATGSEADSGVSQRLRGTFLRWVQDRPQGVFLVATSNDVMSLPPEFLRRGRFDEIFFVDLPNEAERKQIFELHLSRRKRDPSTFDLAQLAGVSEGFSGAEIEATVVGALYRAFGTQADITTEQILAEIGGTVPLSVTRAEDIQKLRFASMSGASAHRRAR